MQKLNTQSSSSFKKNLKKRRQQKPSLKKVQNDKIRKSANPSETSVTIPNTNEIRKELSINTNNSSKLTDKFSNNAPYSSDSEGSDEHNSDTERFSEQEFSKDEFDKLESEGEDVVMQNIKSSSTSEEEDVSNDENSEEEREKENSNDEDNEEWEEENSNDENNEEEWEEENPNEDDKESNEDTDEEMEIVEDTTKISSNKQKEKENISKDETSKITTEVRDPIPTPLLARPQAEKQFRDYYISQMTKAFGEDLDKLRKKEENLNSNKLEILIDALESGINVFSDVEKELSVNKK